MLHLVPKLNEYVGEYLKKHTANNSVIQERNHRQVSSEQTK